jgi:two-component system, LytTR family, sensor kinase
VKISPVATAAIARLDEGSSFLMRSIRWWLIYLWAWLPYFAGLVLVVYTVERVSLHDALVSGAFTVLPPTLLGAGVWWLGERIEWNRGRRRSAAIIIALGLLYAALSCAPVVVAALWLKGHDKGWLFVNRFIFYQYLTALFIYAGVMGVFQVGRISRRLREEQQRAVEAEALKTRAELEALRGRLQPHFLFNTLHSITALVRLDSARAEKALLQLSELLHAVLDAKGGDEDVSLAEEWRFIETYLALEKIRLGDRLRVVVDIPVSLRSQRIPFLTLQPLVENALHHAVSVRIHGGTIRIKAWREKGAMHLAVEDDGPGTELSQLDASSGFGLQIVRRRLAAAYPGRARLDIVTAPGAGFRVMVVLPVEQIDSPWR